MAKKKTDTPVEVVPTKPATELALVRVEAPPMLAPVVNEYGLELADKKVDAHLTSFLPFVANLVEYEDELNKLLTGEITPELAGQAKTLRLKYRDVRTGSTKKKGELKEEIVVEGRFLDKMDKTIGDAATLKEAKCLEIEKHLENLENERLEALKTSRRTQLEAVDYDTEFLNLGEMTDESFARLLKKATEAKEGATALAQQRAKEEQQRKDDEARVTARMQKLAALGMGFDEPNRQFIAEGIGKMDIDVINYWSEADFDKEFATLKGRYDTIQKKKEDELAVEREKAERITNRINAVGALGLTFNTATEQYEGYNQKFALSDIKALQPDEFKDELERVKGLVDDEKKRLKALQVAKDKETADLKKKADDLQKAENERKAAELKKQEDARLAALAPDKDKFKAFYVAIKTAFSLAPTLQTKEGFEVSKRITEISKRTLEALQGEAAKLV